MCDDSTRSQDEALAREAKMTHPFILLVVSGGQTGVDRAAFDAALACAITIGGWAPRGYMAEDGVIPEAYRRQMLVHAGGYRQRTAANVCDTRATLAVISGSLTPGTQQTVDECQRLSKPTCLVNIDQPAAMSAACEFLFKHRPQSLNVAGSRESKRPGIHAKARDFLITVFRQTGAIP